MPGSMPGMPGGMQQRLDMSNPAVSLAQSLGLSRQQEHLMSLAGSSAAAQTAAVASMAAGLGGQPPSHNQDKMGMTNVSFVFSLFLQRFYHQYFDPEFHLPLGKILDLCEPNLYLVES